MVFGDNKIHLNPEIPTWESPEMYYILISSIFANCCKYFTVWLPSHINLKKIKIIDHINMNVKSKFDHEMLTPRRWKLFVYKAGLLHLTRFKIPWHKSTFQNFPTFSEIPWQFPDLVFPDTWQTWEWSSYEIGFHCCTGAATKMSFHMKLMKNWLQMGKSTTAFLCTARQ